MSMQASGGPVRGLATQRETGRACPYCRFPLKEGTEMVQCGACGAPHHEDCWQDNGNGCAVVACAGGPTEATRAAQQPTTVMPPSPAPAYASPPAAPAAVPVAATPPPPPPASPGAAPPMWQPPSPGGTRTGPWVLAAAIVLALAVAGAAVAVVATRKGDDKTVNAAATQTILTQTAPGESSGSSATDEKAAPTVTTDEIPPPSNGVLPAESESQMRSEIQTMLRDWHEDLVVGDYRTAFDNMTKRKQQKALRTDGYAAWARGQKSLGDYIDPSNLQVSILETNDNTGVVTVDVRGMTYSNPRSSCSTWDGVTWVRYEDGEWKYDPGYSTTPQRAREWRPRLDELMGIGC